MVRHSSFSPRRALALLAALSITIAPLVVTTSSGAAGTPHAPSAPRSVLAFAGPSSIKVVWLPPASNGGAPLTEYCVVLLKPAALGQMRCVGISADPSFTWTSLPMGQSYSFEVSAWNHAGISPYSTPLATVFYGTPPPSPASNTMVKAKVTANLSKLEHEYSIAEGNVLLLEYLASLPSTHYSCVGKLGLRVLYTSSGAQLLSMMDSGYSWYADVMSYSAALRGLVIGAFVSAVLLIAGPGASDIALDAALDSVIDGSVEAGTALQWSQALVTSDLVNATIPELASLIGGNGSIWSGLNSASAFASVSDKAGQERSAVWVALGSIEPQPPIANFEALWQNCGA